jgi:hypothetical protein
LLRKEKKFNIYMERSDWDAWSCAPRSASVVFSKAQVAALVDFITRFGNFSDVFALHCSPRKGECKVFVAEFPLALVAEATFLTPAYGAAAPLTYSICIRSAPFVNSLKLIPPAALICVLHETQVAFFEPNSKNFVWSHSALPYPETFKNFSAELCSPTQFSLNNSTLAAAVWAHALGDGFTKCSVLASTLILRSHAFEGGYVESSYALANKCAEFSRTLGTRHLCLLAATLDADASTNIVCNQNRDAALHFRSPLQHYFLHVRLSENFFATQ